MAAVGASESSNSAFAENLPAQDMGTKIFLRDDRHHKAHQVMRRANWVIRCLCWIDAVEKASRTLIPTPLVLGCRGAGMIGRRQRGQDKRFYPADY